MPGGDFRAAVFPERGRWGAPPGTYMVEADEALIEGLSFLAFRRVGTTVYLPLPHGGPGSIQAVRVDPQNSKGLWR